jgi:hypothetical protein
MSQLDDSALAVLSTLPPEQAQAMTTLQIQNMVDQLNGNPQVYPALDPNSPLPSGLNVGDFLVGFNQNNNPQVQIYNGNGVSTISQDATIAAIGFVGPISGVGLPTTAQLPNPGQFGFYTDTSTGFLYQAYNNNGTVVSTQLS